MPRDFGVGDRVLAAADVPLAPRRDDRKVRRERRVGQLEANLIVALAGAAVRERIGADAARDLDLPARDERPRHRGAEQVLAVVDRAGAKRREDEGLDELLAQVFDVAFVGAGGDRLGANAGELLAALTDVGGDADDAAARVVLLEPGNDDRGIEPAGVGENNGAGHVRS